MEKIAGKFIIYLADLDHFHPGNRYNVPLGIGSIASYVKSLYGDALDVCLFKDPNELIEAIRKNPPRVLGCSFYMWNANLTLKMIEASKLIDKNIVTVIGGPSVARNSNNYLKILQDNPELDLVVLDQGEKSFANITERILKDGAGEENIFAKSLAGCASRLNGKGPVIRGEIIAKGIDLNSFPSPYLTGLLDKFLEAGFVSSLETVRGCPYQCTFCSGGINSFLPLSVKNEQTVYAELSCMEKHSAARELDIVDTNFGMLGERDLRISSFMLELYKKTGFPQIIGGASTKQKDKTSMETMLNLARIMGNLYFALQTMTEEVLVNCRRKNVSYDTIKEIVSISEKYRWPIIVDTIFGLLGETVKSFFKTIDKILSLGIDVPSIYILKLLPGTIIAEQEREKYGYKTKFRPINGRYGEYNLFAGQKPARIVETEEIAYQSSSFNLNDYLTIRSFGLINWLLVGKEAFSDCVSYLFTRGIKMTEIFNLIMKNYSGYPRLNNLFNQYKIYSNNELFDSQEELINKIASDDGLWNDLLLNQGKFFKLDQAFTGYCLFEDTGILDELTEIILKGVKNKLTNDERESFKEVAKKDKLCRMIQDKKNGKLTKTDLKKEITIEEIFDYEKWKQNNFKGNLEDYRLKIPVKMIFYIDKFDLINSKIDEFSDLSGYNFYEKIILWGPHSLRRLCRQT